MRSVEVRPEFDEWNLQRKHIIEREGHGFDGANTSRTLAEAYPSVRHWNFELSLNPLSGGIKRSHLPDKRMPADDVKGTADCLGWTAHRLFVSRA